MNRWALGLCVAVTVLTNLVSYAGTVARLFIPQNHISMSSYAFPIGELVRLRGNYLQVQFYNHHLPVSIKLILISVCQTHKKWRA